MKVKELIEELKKMDPEALVVRRLDVEEEYGLIPPPKEIKAILPADGPELWATEGARLLKGDKIVPAVIFE